MVSTNQMKNYGFIPPIMKEEDYVLGGIASLPQDILQMDGNWEKYLPETERQLINIETYNCTSFATCNIFETLFKKRFGENDNFSDRFLGIEAGTNPPGNDPNTVAQTVRHSGMIPEICLPYSGDTWQEYYSFKGGDKIKCLSKGQEFLNNWIPGHEWVFQGPMDKAAMRQALQFSPLGISVSAWFKNENGEYISKGPNNHWTMAYRIDDKGRVYVFDSYDPYYKVLSADHEIRFCKRYSLVKNTIPPNVYLDLCKQLLKLLQDLLLKLQNAKPIGSIIGALKTTFGSLTQNSRN